MHAFAAKNILKSTILQEIVRRAEHHCSLKSEYLSYIAPEVLPIQELLYRLCVSARHYYRLRREAILVLSLRLWSSPDPAMDLWLDLLTL